VVLSDGGDNASRHRLEDVVQMAQQSSATIYTIGIYDDTDLDRNPGALRKIADLSGGRAYFPESLSDLDHVWRDAAGAIRSLYTIGYYSSNHLRDGKFRRVEITAGRNSGKGLRVTTRDGYRGPVAKSTAP
jgi:Ca-activated chloride channel family protein